MEKLGLKEGKPITLHYDNKTTINIASNLVQNGFKFFHNFICKMGMKKIYVPFCEGVSSDVGYAK